MGSFDPSFNLLLGNPKETLRALDVLDGEESLLAFTRRLWPVLEPHTPFVDGWALQAICEHLEAVTDGHINRLLMNVPPGFMKPVHVEELVAAKRGVVPLKDILVGDEVLTHTGRYRGVTAVHEQGMLPTLTVRTFAGRAVRTAPDHPFLTTRGWIKASELLVGDYVGFPRRKEAWGSGAMRPEEARLLGYLVGDGCISHRSLAFVSADADIIEDFISCAAACGFYAYKAAQPKKGVASKIVLKSKKDRWVGTGDAPVLMWLRSHGLYCSNSYTKRIPPEIFASGEEALRNFIGAYWSCDGMFVIRHDGRKTTMLASATTVGEGLADDVLRALALLNINARKRRKQRALVSRKQPGGIYASFDVITSERNEVAKFIGMPGLCGRKSALAAKAFADRFEPEIYADEVVAVEASEPAECRCLSVADDHSFTANGIIVHNSLMTNVFWPAWEWGPQYLAHHRFVTFSYAASLTERDNRRFLDLIKSPDYGYLWGDRFALKKAGETLVSNDKTGWKLASSVGGVATGERGDRILLDDPHSVKESESDVVRSETVRWFREGMSNRLNDMEKSAIVVIMQRVHESDVSGAIIESAADYTHLMIPMEYDGRRYTTSIGWTDPRENDGELAWPERFSAGVVKGIKAIGGPYAYAGQYQQAPSPRGGGIFRRDWWQLWGNDADPKDIRNKSFPACEYIVASLDGAYTEDRENDYSALTIWGLWRDEQGLPKIILLHAWRDRLTIHDLVEKSAASCKRFKVDRLLVEAKASGISVAQELRRLYVGEGWGVQLVDPKGDKVARAYAVQPLFSDGMVYAPDRSWSDMVITEMASFPRASHDDLTDSATQALRHLRQIGLAVHGTELQRELTEDMMHQTGAGKPLYGGV